MASYQQNEVFMAMESLKQCYLEKELFKQRKADFTFKEIATLACDNSTVKNQTAIVP